MGSEMCIRDRSYTAALDVLDYTLTISNTGNVALSSIVINDPNADVGSITCAAGIPSPFLPGTSFDCSAQHTVTAGDVAFTQVNNQAFVNAETPDGTQVSDPSDVVSIFMEQLPPVATDDSFISPVSAVPVSLAGAGNDTDPNNDLDPTTVSLIHPAAIDTDGDGDFDTVAVPGEGTWLVVNTTGAVVFTPLAQFSGDPTPLSYTVSDATGLLSNQALLTLSLIHI